LHRAQEAADAEAAAAGTTADAPADGAVMCTLCNKLRTVFVRFSQEVSCMSGSHLSMRCVLELEVLIGRVVLHM
jgi:hypothetical protein